jgi:hypothetical protein
MKPNNSLPALIAFSLALLVFSASTRAADKSPTPLRVSAGEITDTRTTGAFASECKVELRFVGDAADDAQRVSAVRITKAEDDLGRDLRKKEALEFPGPERQSGVLKTEVKLRNPSRNATVIRILEGEVDLFSPTEANGGIHVLQEALKKPGEPIRDPVLAQLGLQIMYLTRESYEAKKKELEAEQSKSERAGEKFGEAFADLFKGMFSGWFAEMKDAVTFYIHDPQKRLVDLELLDGSGKPLKTQGRMTSGAFRKIYVATPAPPDTQVRLFLATPEAVKTYPFKLENIPLP